MLIVSFKIVAYPNPSNVLINIYLGADKQQAQLDIYNLMGIKFRSEQISSSFTTFDVNSLSVGCYTFRISNEQTQQSRIIQINR